MTYRESAPPPPGLVELAPVIRPNTVLLVFVIACGIAPALVGYSGISTLIANPERSTLECTRTGDDVRCDELDWWKQGDGWRSRKVATHTAKRSNVRPVHIGGRSPKNCIQFEGSLPCGGPQRTHVDELFSLAEGKHLQLDLTRSDGFGLVMGFGSAFGVLAIIWLYAMAVLLGRCTSVRVAVHPRHLEVETRWGGFLPRKARTLARMEGELARVVMADRGGRGQFPTWRMEYGAGTADFDELLTLAALQKPFEIETAAARLRAMLVQIPRG